jgi:hypothetical protein
MSAPTPSSDVYVTAPACPACGGQLPAGRSRRFCSPACRQAAYRRRHQPDAPPEVPLPRCRSRLEGTVYQCPDCESRYLAEQWCPECSRPCRRLGAGGTCPCCEETVTIAELIENAGSELTLARPQQPVHH